MNVRLQPLLEGCKDNRNNWEHMQMNPQTKNQQDEQDRENEYKDDDPEPPACATTNASPGKMTSKKSEWQLLQLVLSCVRKSND